MASYKDYIRKRRKQTDENKQTKTNPNTKQEKNKKIGFNQQPNFKVKVKQSRYRPRVAQKVPGS
jgi:hypothetical protein